MLHTFSIFFTFDRVLGLSSIKFSPLSCWRFFFFVARFCASVNCLWLNFKLHFMWYLAQLSFKHFSFKPLTFSQYLGISFISSNFCICSASVFRPSLSWLGFLFLGSTNISLLIHSWQMKHLLQSIDSILLLEF